MKIIIFVDNEIAILRILEMIFGLSPLSKFYKFIGVIDCATAMRVYNEQWNDVVGFGLDGRLAMKEVSEKVNPFCVNCDSIPIICSARVRDFKGPIITMTSDDVCRKQMRDAGCTHSVEMKRSVIELFEELLLRNVMATN